MNSASEFSFVPKSRDFFQKNVVVIVALFGLLNGEAFSLDLEVQYYHLVCAIKGVFAGRFVGNTRCRVEGDGAV